MRAANFGTAESGLTHLPKGEVMKFKASVFVVACFLVLLGSGREAGAEVDCATRHFYNYSSVPFKISFLHTGKAGSSSIGSCSIGEANGTSCTIPPGQTADLHYANFPDRTNAILIESLDGGAIYPRARFTVEGGCYISHRGNTGNIAVNDSADGDVKTCGSGSYSCR
jgi:hypothetical protein